MESKSKPSLGISFEIGRELDDRFQPDTCYPGIKADRGSIWVWHLWRGVAMVVEVSPKDWKEEFFPVSIHRMAQVADWAMIRLMFYVERVHDAALEVFSELDGIDLYLTGICLKDADRLVIPEGGEDIEVVFYFCPGLEKGDPVVIPWEASIEEIKALIRTAL